MKKLLIGLLVLLFVIVAAALLAPGLIDWTPYRERIAAEIGALTGREVAIEGPVSFTLLPTPRFAAQEVRIASLPGAAMPDLLTAASIDLRVAFWPLLAGRVRVQQVSLSDPVLALEILPDGRRSWEGMEGSYRPEVSLDGVAIENGTLLWRDAASGRPEMVEAISGELSAASLRGPFAARGSATVRGLPVAIDLTTQPATPLGAVPMTVSLGLDAAGLRFAGLALPDGQLQGEVSASGPDLGAVLARVGIAMPAEGLPAQAFSARARVQATPERIDLGALMADIGETRVAGLLGLALGDAPRLDATLEVNRIDAADWLGEAVDTPGVIAAFGKLADGFDPGAAAGALDLSIGAVEAGGALLRGIGLQAALEDGTVTVNRLSSGLPGASEVVLAGSLALDGSQPEATLGVRGSAADLRALLGWAGFDVSAVPAGRLRRFEAAFTLAGNPEAFRVTGAEVQLDGAQLTGGLAYVDRGRPGIGLRLEADRLDIDAYRPPGAPPLLAGLVADPTVLGGFDANLDVRVGALAVDGLPLRDLRLDGTVAGGAIALREFALGGPGDSVVSLAGTVAGLAPLRGIDLAGSASAADAAALARAIGWAPPVAADRLGAVSLEGRVAGAPEELTLDLTVGAAGATAQLAGTAHGGREPALAITARVTHPDLGALAATVRPGAESAEDLGGVDLYAEVTASPSLVTLDGLQGTIGPVALAGRVAAALDGPRPVVEADLRTTELALDRLWPDAAVGDAGLAGQWSGRPFDLSPLGMVDGTLALTASAITAGRWRLETPTLRAALNEGRLSVESLAAGLAGGQLGLSGRIEAGAQPRAAVDLDLVGADLATVLDAAIGLDGPSGRLDLGIEATTAGASAAEMIYGLAGQGLVAVREAEVAGLDLAAVDRLLDDPGPPVPFLEALRAALSEGQSRFAAINATFALEGGLARSEDLRLAAAEGIGTGRFALDLPRWQLDLATGFTLHRHPDAPPFGLRLEGPPNAPVLRLDLEALQDYAAARAAHAPPP